MKNLQANLLKIESTQIGTYPGDTTGDSIIATGSASAEKGETSQVYGQAGLITNPSKNNIGLRLRKGSLDIIIGTLNYSIPIPENNGETLLYSTDEDGVVRAKHYLDNEGIHTFNDGTDFAVRYSALETAFNSLKDTVDNLITAYNAHIHPTPAGPSSPTVSTATPPTADITPSKVEEIKIP